MTTKFKRTRAAVKMECDECSVPIYAGEPIEVVDIDDGRYTFKVCAKCAGIVVTP